MKKVKEVSGTMKSTEEKVTEFSSRKDGIERSIRVREVENGFIVEIRESGDKKGKDGCSHWYCENQTYISTVNPLDDEEEDSDDKVGNVKEAIRNVLSNLKT